MRRLSLCAALLFLVACGSAGLGDLGAILGSPSIDRPSDVRGTVTNVDLKTKRIELDVRYVNSLQTTQSGQSIYYDSRTRVDFQGRTYRPEDLERGDEISVQGANDNGRYVASVITVTRNVRS